MPAPIFIGDELSAAGYRLAGVRVWSPDEEELLKVFRRAREEAELLLLNVEYARRLPPAEIQAAQRADAAMLGLGRIAEGPAEDVLVNASEALTELRGALVEVQAAVSSTRQALERDSDVRIRVNLLMEELTRTARSVRMLTEMLQQRPESMIRGKRESP